MANGRLAAIGLFVLCGVALALAAIMLFGRLALFQRTQTAELVFDGSVSGLDVGAPVTFRGVRVGAVSSVSIELDPATHRAYIPVKLRLDADKVVFPNGAPAEAPSVPEMVAEGLRAELIPVSLISGQTEVYLDLDRSVPARLHPGIAQYPEIPVGSSAAGQVAQRLGELPLGKMAHDAILTMQSVRQLADSLSRRLPQVLESTERSSLKAGQALDAARLAVGELQGRMGVTLAGIDRLTGSADRQMSGRGAELHALLVSSSQAISQASDVLANVQSMTRTQAPDRASLEAALNDLSAASAALRGFATDIEQNPRLLLSGRRR